MDGSRLFAEGVRSADGNLKIRCFDIGGTGVKTALLSAADLQRALPADGSAAFGAFDWLQPPASLGFAPGRDGFAAWLAAALPTLQDEVADSTVVFGISVKGRIVHETQTMRNWYAGGYSIGRDEPRIADIMGLPFERTFALHDGSAHLLACCKGFAPPAGMALFVLGTGVGFAFTNGHGLLLNRLGRSGEHMLVDGDQVATAGYEGAWRSLANGPKRKIMKKMVGQYGDMVSGRLGYEALDIAKEACLAQHPEDAAAAEAARIYGECWLHFLHTRFLPEFTSPSREERYGLRCIGFAGGVAEHNWDLLREVLADADGNLKPLPTEFSEAAAGPAPKIAVVPPAPAASGLVGAAVYALAGSRGKAQHIWDP